MTDKQVHYQVSGMKCNGCEATARNAVAQLPGFVDARFDHKTGTGVVTGDVATQAIIQALTAVGYPASLQDNNPCA